MNDSSRGLKATPIIPPIQNLGAALSAALRNSSDVGLTGPYRSPTPDSNVRTVESGLAQERVYEPKTMTRGLVPSKEEYQPGWDDPRAPLDRKGFITKDSGQRMLFESGMQRDTDNGKLKPHLCMSGPMFARWAGLMTRGAEKYDDDNWMKAEGQAEYDRFRASAFRHFFQWWNGETDEDHAAAVFFNINGSEYVRQKMKNAIY
jgi:hypothetical protein